MKIIVIILAHQFVGVLALRPLSLRSETEFSSQSKSLKNFQSFLLVDERVGHDAELLHLSALLLRQVLHGLLRVEPRSAGAVAVDLPLVLPRLQRALERLVTQKKVIYQLRSRVFVPFQARRLNFTKRVLEK